MNAPLPPDPRDAEPQPPASIEAEQALLGALLVHNDLLALIELDPEDFSEPVHGVLFARITAEIHVGGLASPVTLAPAVRNDPAFRDLGGPAYLARLASASVSCMGVRSYAELVRDLRRRRDLLAALDSARAALLAGATPTVDVTGAIDAAVDKATSTMRARAPVSWLRAQTDAIEEINRGYQGLEPDGVRIGIPAVEKLVPSLGLGQLGVLGGRPGAGKTAVALTIALRAAQAGHPVVFGAFEMTPESLAVRGLAAMASEGAHTAIAYAEALRGTIDEGDFRRIVGVAKAMDGLPVMFLPRTFTEVGAFAQGVRRSLRRMAMPKPPLVIVDYLQLMDVRGASRFEKVTAVSLGLKGLAMTNRLPILALSQLSRDVDKRDDKRPVLGDLRESGQIEQDADLVIFAYREEYYLARAEPSPEDADKHLQWQAAMQDVRGRLELIVAKQRQGTTGTARVRFAAASNRIWEE